jgi:hypothetical protein
MRIKLQCSNGHYEFIWDGRHSIPPLEKLKWWVGRNIPCKDCDALITEAYEVIQVEVEA